ncbi:MAG TPA: hypothetical protein VGK17_14170, partial [Propionicimonas sp.]
MNHQTIIWGCFCLVALGASLKWPTNTRRFLGGFFIVMGVGVNLVYVLLDPEGFVRIGTDARLLSFYAWAFSTLVALWPIGFGVILASYEVALGTMMIVGGRPGRWGLLAGITFLVASTPLSTWTLPNLILAAALIAILLREP